MFTPLIIITVLILYLSIVRLLRYQRRDYHRSLAQNPSFLKNNPQIYYKVYYNVGFLEFPYIINKALQQALFKTYAIPSVSALLHHTKYFEDKAINRAEETSLLVREFTEQHYDSERGQLGIKRLNAIHGAFNISNNDYLYVLSTFIFEPIRIVNLFGFRSMEPIEEESLFRYWKDIGVRMHIQNIPNSIEEFKQWKEDYEKKYMKYSKSNQLIGNATLKLFAMFIPSFLQPLAFKLFCSLIEDRLLHAMDYPVQPKWLQKLSASFLHLFGIFIRFCMPPRPSSWAVRRTPVCGAAGATHEELFWDFKSVFPNGYRVQDIGGESDYHPKGKLESLGRSDGPLVCPFSMPKSKQ
eukprot:gb/GECH01001239.1/.p1 GENE.gb/GECH01001239.1/~~gb/GECH01001239.1/.p1  ORF type:complete len:353 (+),score=83.54 gb/GECH01001239.1/:1-1059(+)